MRGNKRKVVLFLAAGIFAVFFADAREGCAQTARDPFSSLISKSGFILVPRDIEVSNLNLGGIIYSENDPMAVVNDEVLGEGDKLGEYIVYRIEEKKVILKKGDEESILKLEEE